MKHLNYSILSLSAIAAVTTSCSSNGEKSTDRDKTPNVIYILADDLGYGDLSCNGQQYFSTPNIDAMAKEGMNFTQNYAGSAVSAPSRCTIMTGKHTGESYIRGNQSLVKTPLNADGNNYGTPLADEEITVAEIFKQANYSTACIGKWGLGGPNSEGAPTAQGFDYFYGYLSQGDAHKHFPPYLHENNTLVELDGNQYSHELFEQKALDYIRENKDRPFFIYLAFTLVHAELLMPEDDMINQRGKFDEPNPYEQGKTHYGSQPTPRAAFAAMAERLDLSVGRVNSLLKELGIDENTLVIFTSDNGPHIEGGADPEFFDSNNIYRGIKRDLYEGGIRVPMIASWKGKIPAGVVNNSPIAFWDVLPTLADLIGQKAPESCNGISMVPSLMGETAPKHDYLYWELNLQGGKQAIREGDWKLLKLNTKLEGKTYYELYNIALDPSEENNVIEQNGEIAEKLKELMAKARTETPLYDI
ncbi:MAG: arylsulfatase [Rikenellaceae bacterium]